MVILTINIAFPINNSENKNFIFNNELISSIEKNTNIILNMLEAHEYKASFYIEISLAKNLEKLLKTIAFSGHEIALYNVNSTTEEIQKVKKNLEELLQKPIRGLRQKKLRLAYPKIKEMDFGYVSNIEESSINFLWRKLTNHTEIYTEDEVSIIPESQSPYSQLPFNDYVLQVTPIKYYESMLLESLQNKEYVMLYFNVWQLYNKDAMPFKLPFYKKINLGSRFEDRLEELFQFVDEHEIAVTRMKDYLF